VFLAAPTSSDRRLRLIAEYSSGFIYLVSRTGVTGEQTKVSSTVAPLVERMRALSNLPLAVGFGVSKPEHVAEIGRIAPGVVVGSAIMSLIEKYGDDPDLEARLERFAGELKSGFGQ
jgi:tryptophan synthase alpha chain